MGFRVEGFGFSVYGFELRVQGVGAGVNPRPRLVDGVHVLDLRVQGSGARHPCPRLVDGVHGRARRDNDLEGVVSVPKVEHRAAQPLHSDLVAYADHPAGHLRYSSQFKNDCLAEMWSSSEKGSCLRLIDCCITQL